jgi:hypothetical protein
MDSVAMCDAALASSGFQQWSAHAANELPALLASFKSSAPDDFDLFFAMNRLDVQPVPGTPGSFQLLQLDATDTGTPMSYAQIRSFLGGALSADGKTVTFTSDWAGRLRIVALASEAYRVCQLLTAASRFDRVAGDAGTLHIAGQSVAATQIMTSEFAAALLLDTDINRPAHVHGVLQAQASLPGLPADDAGRDTALTQRFHDNRNVYDRPHRNHRIDALPISHDHGSFGGW